MKKTSLFLIMLLFCISSFTQDFETNQIYIKTINEFSENLSYQDVSSFDNVFNINLKDIISKYSIITIEKPFKTKDENLQHTYLVKFSKQSEINEIINSFENLEIIEYAEKVPTNELFYTPNDPQFAQQWNLNTIQAEQAWNISTGNTQVVVAVTDNAILTTHQDLANNIWVNPLEIAGNGIDDDGNGYIDDINGWDAADNDNDPNPINLNNDHGTHVSGIVAATTDNNLGIASIGFNIKIMAVKIGSSPSGSLSGAYAGIDYAISTGQADVINMSWGRNGAFSQTEANVITAAHNAGIVLVAAAGNDNTNLPHWPASYNFVISVGATNVLDQKASFSTYGATVDVMAPGRSILSTLPNTTNDAYGIKSGTSMASPLVAGLCGLMISNTPGITPAQVETCLKNTCVNIDALNPAYVGQIGAGRINAFQALQCFNTPPTADFSVDFENPCIGQQVQFTDLSSGTQLTNWLWDFGDLTPTSTLQNPTHTYATAGSYTVTLTATNAFGTDTETKINFIVTNTPSAILSGSSNIVSGGNAYLQIQFTGNAPFDFVYTDGTTNFTETGITNNPYYFPVSPTVNSTYTLVSVSDAGCGGTVSGSAIITMYNDTATIDTTCNLGQYIMNDNGLTEAQSIAYTDDGGFIIAGFTTVSGAGGKDVFVTKYDDQNNVEWSNTYGTSSDERGYPVNIIQVSNGFVLTLNSKSFSSINFVLTVLYLNLNGNIQWQKHIDNITHRSNSRFVTTNNFGEIIISGDQTISGLGASDNYIILMDILGNVLWSRTYGNSGNDHIFCTIQTENNGYISGGSTETYGTGLTSKLLIKHDQNGIFEWAKYYNTNNNIEVFHSIQKTIDNNYCLIGREGLQNSYSPFLTKIDSLGNIIWSKKYTGLNSDVGTSLKITQNGDIYFSGYGNSFGNGSYDLFLTKTDANGNEIWTKFYGSTGNDNIYNISNELEINEAEGKIYLFGNSTTFGGSDKDPYIIITDLDGNSDCNTVSANWTVTNETPTVGNAPGTIGSMGTMSNSSLVVNPFVASLDTLCNTVCSSPILNSCNLGQYIMDDNGLTEAQSIANTDDGGFIIAGFTTVSGAGGEDIFVTKYDDQNNVEWSNTYGTSSDERGYALHIIQSNTGYALTHSSKAYSPSLGAIIVMSLNTNGTILWQKKLDGNIGYSHGRYLMQDNSNDLLISGSINTINGFGLDDAFAMKLDNTNGNLLWSITYGLGSNDHSHDIYQLEDNNYIFGAASRISGTYTKLILKISNSGTILWKKNYVYYSNNNEIFSNYDTDSNGDIFVVGYSNNNFIITKMDTSGTHIWSKEYANNNNNKARTIKILPNNEILIAGNSDIGNTGNFDLFLSKLDANGNELWTKYYGGSGIENFYGSAKPSSINVIDELIYLFGNTTSFGGADKDPYIIITDLDGNSDCNTVSASWTVTNVTPVVTIANGSIGTLGTMSNSSLVVNPFVASLDTLCSTVCNTPINPTACFLGQYVMDDNGLTNPQSIAYTSDGGFIISGHTNVSGAGLEDVFVTKYDDQNNVEWSNTYGTSIKEQGWSIYISNTQNGYLISLQSGTQNTWGLLTIFNIDFNGNIIWQKKINQSQGYATSAYNMEDDNGDYIFSASVSTTTGFGLDDAYILKMDNAGNIIWSKTFGTNTNDHSFCALQTPDNGYLYGGTSKGFGNGSSSKFLVKVDNNGIYSWSKYYDQDYNARFYDFKISIDSFIYAVGTELNTSNNQDASVSKIDLNGNLIWSKRYSGSNNETGTSIEILQSGELYISGFTNSFGNGSNDLYLTKLDASGNEIWTKMYGGISDESFDRHMVSPLRLDEVNQKIYLYGRTTSFGGSDIDPYIIMTDLDGNSDCNTISANWTVTIETPTVGNAPGSIGSLGTFSNSSLVVNPFVASLDTLCSSLCDTTPIILCENSRTDTSICFGDSIQINLPNGTDYYWNPNYNISDNQIQNPILYPTVDTSYIVFYVNADSCSVLDTVNITVNPLPIVTASPNDTTICPSNCVSLNAIGATMYNWSPASGLNNSNISNPTACPTSSTQYIVTGTNSFSCSATDTVNVNILACCGAYADFSVSDSILCVGESLTITNNSIINPPATHSWIFNGATPLSSTVQNPPSITYNTTGVFTIQYILSDACGTDTLEKTIYVYGLPYIETANDTTICDSSTLMYDIGGIEIGGYNYSWLPTSGLNDATDANPTATVNSSVQYIVTVTDEFSTCVNYDTVNIVIENLPIDFIVSNSNSICEGDTIIINSSFDFDSIVWNGNITVDSIELILLSDSIVWAEGFYNNCSVLDTINVTIDTIPDLNLITNDTLICIGTSLMLEANSTFPILWNTSETNNIISVNPNSTTTYIVTAINGLCAISDSVLVAVDTLPILNIIPSDTGICLGESIQLEAISSSALLWNTGQTSNIITVNPSINSLYFVSATNGVCTISDSINISVDTIPDLNLITNDTAICLGENINLAATSSFPLLWSTNETTSIINVNPTINTSYFVSASNGYCSISDSVLISILSLPNITISGPDTLCINSMANLTANGGITYSWTNADNLSGINNTATILSDTTIYLSGQGVCVNTDSLNVYVIDSNFVTITGEDTICEAMPLTLTANGNGNYSWNTGASTQSISPVLYVDENFYVSSGSGICPIATDSFLVTVFPYPVLTTNGPISTTQGQTINLDVNGANYYIWNPTTGLSCITCNNPSLQANESIVYYIEGSNDYCTSMDSIEISVTQLDQCIVLPDAFSPNNDAVNNTFFPILKSNNVEILEFKIYNRWGENIHNSTTPWDGTYKGENQGLKVYVYYVTYVCNGKEKSIMGNVTLLR